MIRTATIADRLLIRDLQRKFTNQIGFIPSEATERELARGNIRCGDLNGYDAGFLLIQPRLAGQPTTAAIIQAAVYLDAQRQQLGLALVNRAAKDAIVNRSSIIQATCREDLEACAFWTAAGFVAVATRPGGKAHGKNLIIFRKPLHPGIDITILPIDRKPRGAGGLWVKAGTEILPNMRPELTTT